MIRRSRARRRALARATPLLVRPARASLVAGRSRRAGARRSRSELLPIGRPLGESEPATRGPEAAPLDGTRAAIAAKLEQARRALLDLTARNRLLHTPRHSARSKAIEIVDERCDEVFRLLVAEARTLSFVAAPEPAADGTATHGIAAHGTATHGIAADDTAAHGIAADGRAAHGTAADGTAAEPDALGQPEEEVDARGVAARHADQRLQTELADPVLQKKLLALFYDARTAEEEHGVNILYLAIGFLRWHEPGHADLARHAPLLLVPCELTRARAGGRICLRAREDEITTNLSLEARIAEDLGVELPPVPDGEDLVPSAYFAEVRAALAGVKGFEVLEHDMVLGLFSFAKFLMYRDLDARTWCGDGGGDGGGGADGVHAIVDRLLGTGFASEPPLWESGRIDDHVPPRAMVHVADADSSQIAAIEAVKAGRNLVIQGPPGTGKSQTICNLIAAAVVQGKRVLFVAEKQAALEVVRARLAALGLDAMCLELHSRKANKKQMLAGLEATLGLAEPRAPDIDAQVRELEAAVRVLNRHADALHAVLEPAGITPFRVLGEIVRHLRLGTPVPDPDLDLAHALQWTRAEFESKHRLMQGVCGRLSEGEPPFAHPWRGAQIEALLPTDLPRLRAKVDALRARLAQTVQASDALAARQSWPAPASLAEVERLAAIGEILAAAPDADFSAFAAPEWSAPRRELRELVQLCTEHAALAAAVDAALRPEAWQADLRGTRAALARHARSWLRFLSGAYRSAKTEVARLARGAAPDVAASIAVLEQLERAQALRARISERSALGAACFGRLWDGARSDGPKLARILEWVERHEADLALFRFPAFLAAVADIGALVRELEELRAAAAETLAAARAVAEAVQLDVRLAFGANDLGSVPLAELGARAERWSAETERLTEWVRIARDLAQIREHVAPDLAGLLYSGTVPPAVLAQQLGYAYHEGWMREVTRRWPELAAFDGRIHGDVVLEFRRRDAERIASARAEVAAAHWRGLPKDAEDAEVATVQRETKKKKRHLPIRTLMDRAGTAVQRIKPVFMMSPLSVAQFLAPGRVEFDLLLIDEASQVQPVDAFGAILRSKQVVVVGDERQLPPTSFFDRMNADEGEADPETIADVESILGLCLAQGMPSARLRWHYRSQHQSLIAVSNRLFYDGDLHVVPSPFVASDELGLQLHYLPDGVYDRGGSAANRIEALRVAEAAIAHARARPHESLGIGTFSVAQRDAILHELERLWRSQPDVAPFFAASKPSPFFVKNLENIQGDERDVIFVSVGYGKDQGGAFAMGFGPLSNDGGERRLNVLITRASKRCEVFTSIRSADIDLQRARSRGARALKEFLAYAEAGGIDTAVPGAADDPSPFEDEVACELRAMGHEVERRIGIAGFYVDVAVVDPRARGRYLLGIECDGAAYHAARSARDRDRLRQEVLARRGWTIHRIWSTDWFKDREGQKRRVAEAIAAAQRATQPALPPAAE
jgi:very-short-patch-repair endonuclease